MVACSPRRARNPKLGGGHASILSSNINLVNTSTSEALGQTPRVRCLLTRSLQLLAPEHSPCPRPCPTLVSFSASC